MANWFQHKRQGNLMGERIFYPINDSKISGNAFAKKHFI